MTAPKPAKPRWCNYCRLFKPDEGFRLFKHVPSGAPRSQCAGCQATRKLSREKLNDLAVQDREARREELSLKTKASIEERKRQT